MADAVDLFDRRAALPCAPAREAEGRDHDRIPAGVADRADVVRAAHRVAGLPMGQRLLEQMEDPPVSVRAERLRWPRNPRAPARIGLGDVAAQSPLRVLDDRHASRPGDRRGGRGDGQSIADRTRRTREDAFARGTRGLHEPGHQGQAALRVALVQRGLGLAQPRRHGGEPPDHQSDRPPDDGAGGTQDGHQDPDPSGPRVIRSRPIRSARLARPCAARIARRGCAPSRPGRLHG